MGNNKIDYLKKMKKKRGRLQPSNSHQLYSSIHPVVQEAYKTARVNLQFALAAAQSKAVVISSPVPMDGKSITCANLGIVLAQTGKRVLIIDADLRKPKQHSLFKQENTQGLSNILAQFDLYNEVLHQNVRPNLDLLTAGEIPPNPMELLGSSQMASLLEMAERNYGFVLIDSPPINAVSDSLVVSEHTAGVVLVVRENKTTHEDIQAAMGRMKMTHTKALGLVVTQVGQSTNRNEYYT